MKPTRVREALIRYIREQMGFIKPRNLSFTDDFVIEYRGDIPGGALISVRDPIENMPRYYEIRITEKVS